MSSSSQRLEQRSEAAALSPLLDAAFGFFVWAVHFLTVYIAAAVACQLGLGAESAGSRRTFLTTLALVTLAAAAVVLLHAARRYQQQREAPDQRFRMSVTIGGDGIAVVAIAWQLFALFLVPLCA
jgi:membrane protein implicated in regulation of membrane protease activity